MSKHIKATGSSSIILGEFYYKNFLPIKKNKLVKLTLISDNHNEFKNSAIIKDINNYSDYFIISDEKCYKLKYTNKFHKYVRKLVQTENLKFINYDLQCFYIDYGGSKDLGDTIHDISKYGTDHYWKSAKKILKFIKHIMLGICFLNKNKICHLDIKVENIMVDTVRKKYKLIDFGFSSLEPFDDYVNNVRGTPGYFPRQFKTEKPSIYFPKINANDCEIINDKTRFQINRKLVYKIDSYCFGRVINVLKVTYDDHKNYCINTEKKSCRKIEAIKEKLLINDVSYRYTIKECLEYYNYNIL